MIALEEYVEVRFIDKCIVCYEADYQELEQRKDAIEDRVYSQIGRVVFKKLKENKNFVARLREEGWNNSPNGPNKEFRVIVEIYELTTNTI